ncbi:peptidoglycan DD-metalloendopeptidase family protein [Streptomyces levis]|uniref:peptidoglycan DD-metalloendopeptidase family protein n=1 Tax=Streptomyces levis TaxID=285566 RepID=UPI003C7B998F
MTLELGDHVWYWNHRVSIALNIPRADWFPGSDPSDPTDYQGHGKEIYNFVIHADEIARGRPHMRNYEGSFAWLNNNPGNITGRPGGPDFGQYPGKFNWHNFLIFPTWADGWYAIAKLLRSTLYINLSILEAFKKYAPEADGNNPVAYANSVAVALGVPVSTTIGDLNESQMAVMQNKIQEIEGAIPGTSLTWNSDEIPVEVSDLLPGSGRNTGRPRALLRGGSAFTIDISAPVDTSGFTQGHGGPGQGGHVGTDWYIRYGMDLGGTRGTPVYASFDGHITKYKPHTPAQDTQKVYGAQIFMRSWNDMMGAFYTHLTDVPDAVLSGARVSRGDYLGAIHQRTGVAPHLHMALVEIIGGAPGGQYEGVDLYDFFLALEQSEPETVVPVHFSQNGLPPEPDWRMARLGAQRRPQATESPSAYDSALRAARSA